MSQHVPNICSVDSDISMHIYIHACSHTHILVKKFRLKDVEFRIHKVQIADENRLSSNCAHVSARLFHDLYAQMCGFLFSATEFSFTLFLSVHTLHTAYRIFISFINYFTMPKMNARFNGYRPY